MSASMTLFDLAESVLVLRELLDEEADDAIAQRLDEYLGDLLPSKVEGYCKFMRGLTLESDAFKAEEKRCGDRKRAMLNLAKRMKERLHAGLALADVSEVKAGTFSVKVQASPPSLEIYDEEAIPGAFKIMHTTIDKAAIKALLQKSMDVPGARLVHSSHVRIR